MTIQNRMSVCSRISVCGPCGPASGALTAGGLRSRRSPRRPGKCRVLHSKPATAHLFRKEISMDSHDKDLALVAELKRLDAAPRGTIPIASLSASLQRAFEQGHPLAACPVIDGQMCIQPADWLMFKVRQTQDVMHRMRKRSLRLAWDGPSANDLARAPVLSHWLAVMEPRMIGLALMGSAPNHPICVDDLIVTSRLCGICQEGTWARTISRWYRLEHPATLDAFMERNVGRVRREDVHPVRMRDVILMTTFEQAEETQ